MDCGIKSCLAAGSAAITLIVVLVPALVFSQEIGRVVRTEQLQMTGLHPGARVVRTGQLQMTGLHPGARVIRTEQLQMTGLHPGARVVRTGQLLMTGLGDISSNRAAEELPKHGSLVPELSAAELRHVIDLDYPTSNLDYPTLNLNYPTLNLNYESVNLVYPGEVADPAVDGKPPPGEIKSKGSSLADASSGEVTSHGGQCGPVDLDRYCREQHGAGYTAVLLEAGTGNDWRCAPPVQRDAQLEDISVATACHGQYGPWAAATLTNPDDGYGWCCAVPPATSVVVNIKKIWVLGNGELAGDGELEASFVVRHLAEGCAGDTYQSPFNVCEAWSHEVRAKQPDQRTWEIGYVTPPIRLYPESVLAFQWSAMEHDTSSPDDACGMLIPRGDGYSKSREDPIRLEFLGPSWEWEHRAWRFTREYSVEGQFFGSRYRLVDPETGELGSYEISSRQVDVEAHLRCWDNREKPLEPTEPYAVEWGALVLEIDFSVTPAGVDPDVMYSSFK